MRVVTFNVWDLPAPMFVRDARKVRRMFPNAVLLLQEVETGRKDTGELDTLRRVFPDHRVLHGDTYTPMLLPPHLRVLDLEQTVLHKGHAGSTPTRRVVEAVVEHRNRPHLDPFALLGTHFVSGSDWRDPTPDAEEAFRRELWHTGFPVFKSRVSHYADEQEMTVLWAGDVNARRMPRVHRRERRLIDAGIDKMGVVEGGVRVELRDVRRVPMRSDHDLRAAQVRLWRAR